MSQGPDVQFGRAMWLHDAGNGNMGDVDDPTVLLGRFHLSGDHAVGVVRIHFGGIGATLADVAMKLDSAQGNPYDVELYRWENVGLTVDVPFRTPANELWQWLVPDGDHVVFEYTNPHPGTLTWGISLALLPMI